MSSMKKKNRKRIQSADSPTNEATLVMPLNDTTADVANATSTPINQALRVMT